MGTVFMNVPLYCTCNSDARIRTTHKLFTNKRCFIPPLLEDKIMQVFYTAQDEIFTVCYKTVIGVAENIITLSPVVLQPN